MGGEPGRTFLEFNKENSRKSYKRIQDSKSGQDVDVELFSKIRTEIHICSWQK